MSVHNESVSIFISLMGILDDFESISSEWFLDSACCNHMTDNPHLTSAYTPPVLPTITTADGFTMTVSHVGSISTPNYLSLMFFVFLNCISIFYLLAN